MLNKYILHLRKNHLIKHSSWVVFFPKFYQIKTTTARIDYIHSKLRLRINYRNVACQHSNTIFRNCPKILLLLELTTHSKICPRMNYRIASPHLMTFSGIGDSSSTGMVDGSSSPTPLTRKYSSCPRYQYSAFCDLRFHSP